MVMVMVMVMVLMIIIISHLRVIFCLLKIST